MRRTIVHPIHIYTSPMRNALFAIASTAQSRERRPPIAPKALADPRRLIDALQDFTPENSRPIRDTRHNARVAARPHSISARIFRENHLRVVDEARESC